jgi:HPr kinase/phosphorylase
MFQGTLVNVHGIGVLIVGQPGIGKSLAAINLMRSGHKLIADDLLAISKQEPGKLVGQALEENVRIEVRGLGIFEAQSLFENAVEVSSPIDIMVELTSYLPERDAGRIRPQITQTGIMDCFLEKILVPLPVGMDPGLLVELIVQTRKRWSKFEQA